MGPLDITLMGWRKVRERGKAEAKSPILMPPDIRSNFPTFCVPSGCGNACLGSSSGCKIANTLPFHGPDIFILLETVLQVVSGNAFSLEVLPDGTILFSDLILPIFKGIAQVCVAQKEGKEVFLVAAMYRRGQISGREQDRMWNRRT